MSQYDLLIIGGGPAGISAAVNAASEGLTTILCDANERGFGGQAGTSSLIENFLGFPDGISGAELTRRAITQAAKFGTEFRAPFHVASLQQTESGMWNVESDDEDVITAKAVLLAMGVSYRILQANNLPRFTGCGVSYGSPSLSDSFDGRTIAIVGSANSAGQAAVYLAQCPNCRVKLIIRAGSIADKMSAYLIHKIAALPNIEVITGAEVLEAKGNINLEAVSLKVGSEVREIELDRMFILIGAKAKTAWLKGTVTLDEYGFVVTGGHGLLSMAAAPGLFAAGDVRSRSVKRVASAVGEGARAVQEVHAYLSSFAASTVFA